MVFLEWLDFTLYLYLAKSIFAKEFFPNSAYSLTLTFALFAAAYLARPLGGWLFGSEADKNGRRKPLVFSSALMGLATIGISLLPGYNVLGIYSTWILLFLRLIQGLALGGEINTSGMFMVEHHTQKPLWAGSLVAVSGALGMFLGGTIAALLQSSSISILWRLVFALVGIISLYVCRLRKKLKESPEFLQAQSHKSTIPWTKYWPGLINIAITGAFVSVSVYICNIFWVSFAIDQKLWSSVQCSWAGSLAQCGSAILALFFAFFTSPTKCKKLFQGGMIIISLAAPALFYFTAIQSTIGVIFSLGGYVLCNSLICSSLFYFLYLQLPAQYRCRGVSTIYALSATLGAILLPICQQIASTKSFFWLPAGFVSLVAIISWVVVQINKQQPEKFEHSALAQFN
ncbi:proline/glycine betaine transporter (plasmid) [Legionella adelaidensis]|uniref:Proline/glycine betaine transporter n=2 Tax=Legionella adelaidensis TaxID=45056 RepID=A0A0W0R2N5_9GAMM|nr:proline/glycine betaine transporter-like protein [Legionella adelaidensis]VEH86017.1 proline/glycine betaine transporter [Legionella adelaidensis]